MTRNIAPISAYIISKNEASVLGACLDSLDICREIVIVDSGSTDGTLELIEDYTARGFPIRLIQRKWPGFAQQKQFALEQCTSAWCLKLDCDERLDEQLRAELMAGNFDRPDVAGYSIKRPEYLPGYGYPPAAVHAEHLVRLVRKDRASYDQGLAVHESLRVDGQARKLARGRILHFRNLSINQDFSKMNGYSRLKALAGHQRGKTSSFSKIMLMPLAQFLKFYLGQRFFLCGTPGLIYSVMLSSYVFMTEAKLYRLSRNGMPSE